MSMTQFPAPVKQITPSDERVQYARLSLDYTSAKPMYFFEDGKETDMGDFENLLSLLNQFGGKGWDVSFKETNHTIYLKRFYK